MQTKKESALEAFVNILSGMVIAWTINVALVHVSQYIPGFNFTADLHSLGIVTIILTAVSIARSYLWRRLFNHLHSRKNKNLCYNCGKKTRKKRLQ